MPKPSKRAAAKLSEKRSVHEKEEEEAPASFIVDYYGSRVFRCKDLATGKEGTCFYLKTDKPKESTGTKPRHLFASAARVFSAAAQPEIMLQADEKTSVPATVYSSSAEDDLVILQIEEELVQFPSDMPATKVAPDNRLGERVFIMGVGGSVAASISKTINPITAGKPLPALADGRLPRHFCVLDRPAPDESFSGSPVVNKWGRVMGVLGEVNRKGASWALIAYHLGEALDPPMVFVEPPSPPSKLDVEPNIDSLIGV